MAKVKRTINGKLTNDEVRVLSYVIGCLIFCMEELDSIDSSVDINDIRKYTEQLKSKMTKRLH